MRKVVSGLFISLDGVVQAPNEWQFDNFDEDMATLMGAFLETEDTVLLGRVTYQEWAPYWPTSTDEPYASHINNTPKYVASTTLKQVEWQNSTLITGSVADEVARLKQLPGKDIGVAGSPTLVRWLLRNDLLDELILMVHPVIAGRGKRLFEDGSDLKRLRLTDSLITRTGVAVLTYRTHEPD
jgi:dihydrofolate reductase